MLLLDGYCRHKKTCKIEVRPMTLMEAQNASGHISFIANDGKLRRAKVNGKVKLWKRNPARFAMPIKYGMYEYTTFTEADLGRLVVPIA